MACNICARAHVPGRRQGIMESLYKSKLLTFVILCILLILPKTIVSDHSVTTHCQPDWVKCEFSLTVGFVLSMTSLMPNDIIEHRRPIVIFPNGTFALRTLGECNELLIVNKSVLADAITLDGTYKMILTVNGQMPGPAIVVYEGQEVVVNVTNDIFEEVTIHWHGQHQMGTPWMDGVSGLSQCPIHHGETFTYRFIAHPTGTFWYHSHHGVQRSEGLYGPLIVLPRPGSTQHQAERQFPIFTDDFHMMIQDFYKQSSLEIFNLWTQGLGKFSRGYNDLENCYEGREHVDGRMGTYVEPSAVLINGKGWHYPANSTTPENPGVPLDTYHVIKGNNYRFRVANAALEMSLRVSIDSHILNVMATDETTVKSRPVESVIIAPGERYDFWITTSDPDGSGLYWIRVEGIEWSTGDTKHQRVLPFHGEAVLKYSKANHKTEQELQQFPSSKRATCMADSPCQILNCPYKSYPEKAHMECISITLLDPAIPDGPMSSHGGDVIEKFLHLHFAGSEPPYNKLISSINSKQFKMPSAPPQTYPSQDWASRHGLCDFDDVCEDVFCPCTHVLEIPTGKIIQLVLVVMAHPSSMTHPVHIHGHSFQVIKIGYPTYDTQTSHVAMMSGDIKCAIEKKDEECNQLTWTNSSWAGGNLPGVAHSVVRKDTIAVPVGGYVVIQFESTNPGFWFLHCHMEFHVAHGMALVIREGEVREMPATPKGFKTCGSFYWSEEEFQKKTNYEQDSYLTDLKNRERYNISLVVSADDNISNQTMGLALGLSLSLLVIAILICVMLVILLKNARAGYTKLPSGDQKPLLTTLSGELSLPLQE